MPTLGSHTRASRPTSGRSELPPPSRALVIITSDDPGVSTTIRSLGNDDHTIDIRSSLAWVDVGDARRFFRSVISALDAPEHELNEIRVAWTPHDAGVDQLVGAALSGCSLLDVHRAIQADDAAVLPPTYQIHYQPIVQLVDRSVIGFEALIRAHDADREMNAEEVIERAHRDRWLGAFDQLARRLAIEGVGSWLGHGLLFLNMMAPDGDIDVDAIEATISLADSVGLAPDQLVFEAVEQNRYRSVDEASRQLAHVRSLGARIALDDVGDGYATLALLSAFQPDVVKISGSIVDRLSSTGGRAVIDAVVALAHDLDAWVVAESIENEQQALTLVDAGVDWGQGRHLGAPAARADH